MSGQSHKIIWRHHQLIILKIVSYKILHVTRSDDKYVKF